MFDARPFIQALVLILFSAWSSSGIAEDLSITDPTRPPHAAGKNRSEQAHDRLVLVSTSISVSARSAVINDEVVTIGATIAGAVVTDIEQGRVTLLRGSEVVVLQLYTPPVKRPARDSS